MSFPDLQFQTLSSEILGPVGTDAQVFDSGFRPYPLRAVSDMCLTFFIK